MSDLIERLNYWGGKDGFSPVKGTALGGYCLQAAARIAALEAQVAALTAQYRPSMTDMMVDPETIDEMEYDHRAGDENAD